MTLTLEKDHQDQGEREKYLFSEYFTSQFLFFRSNLSSQLCINSKKQRYNRWCLSDEKFPIKLNREMEYLIGSEFNQIYLFT